MNGVHFLRGARALTLALALAALALSAPPAARAQAHPAITGPVTDLGGYLTAAEREAISAKLAAYREATGIQLAALLVPTTGGVPIEDYAQAVFDAWGGGSKERNDGALFVLAVNDRRSRLQLGYGLESYVADMETLFMLDRLRPLLRAEAYAAATGQLIDELWAATAEVRPGAPLRPPLPRRPWFLAAVLLVAMGWAFWLRERRPSALTKKERAAEQKRRRKAGLPELPPAPPPAARRRRKRLHVIETVVLFLVAPALLGIATYRALGSAVAYPLVWVVFAFLGRWCSHARTKAKRISRWVFYALDLAVVGPLFWFLFRDGLVSAVDCMILGGVVFLVGAFLTVKFTEGPSPLGGTSLGGGGARPYGRSGWSSSGSSSRSASSWSGGGGSSGGGGASSSW